MILDMGQGDRSPGLMILSTEPARQVHYLYWVRETVLLARSGSGNTTSAKSLQTDNPITMLRDIIIMRNDNNCFTFFV